ncbi:MAG: hypothetical protein ACRC7U_06815 [Moraxella sp.]
MLNKYRGGNIHRHTGGLEKGVSERRQIIKIHRHTGGLEMPKFVVDF